MSSSLLPILSQINLINHRFIIYVYSFTFHLVIVRLGRKSRTVEIDGSGGKKSVPFLVFCSVDINPCHTEFLSDTAEKYCGV
jgi:hypothetical protein